MSYKPADFYLGVIDFFAVILPGAVITLLLVPFIGPEFPPAFDGMGSPALWGMFFLSAYYLGHILHQLGFLLDKLYDKTYVDRYKRRSGDDDLLRDAKKCANDWIQADLWQRCNSLVRVHNAAAAAEIDRLSADSKFFRSMTFVVFVSAFTANQGEYTIGLTFLLLGLFSFWRFCYLRWKATELIYEYFIILRPVVQNIRVLPATVRGMNLRMPYDAC